MTGKRQLFLLTILLCGVLKVSAQTPDLRPYMVTISGQDAPEELGQGKALDSMVRHIGNYESALPRSDYSVLLAAQQTAGSFKVQVIDQSHAAMLQLCREFVSDREIEDVDAAAVAAGIHRRATAEEEEYANYYQALVAALSSEARNAIYDVILPDILSRRSSTYLDHEAAVRDHEDFMKELYVNGCRGALALPPGAHRPTLDDGELSDSG